jgi:hypothetical protein
VTHSKNNNNVKEKIFYHFVDENSPGKNPDKVISSEKQMFLGRNQK